MTKIIGSVFSNGPTSAAAYQDYATVTADDSKRPRETAAGWRYPGGSNVRVCNCIGSQPGQPVCPCRMANLKIRDGRWVEVIDHGPAKS